MAWPLSPLQLSARAPAWVREGPRRQAMLGIGTAVIPNNSCAWASDPESHAHSSWRPFASASGAQRARRDRALSLFCTPPPLPRRRDSVCWLSGERGQMGQGAPVAGKGTRRGDATSSGIIAAVPPSGQSLRAMHTDGAAAWAHIPAAGPRDAGPLHKELVRRRSAATEMRTSHRADARPCADPLLREGDSL